MAQAQSLGGELIAELESAQAPSGGVTEVWERIASMPELSPERPPETAVSGRDDIPIVLAPNLPDDLNAIRWRSLVPGIRQHMLANVDSAAGSVCLLSIDPGITIPHHTHGGGELTLVLQGSYTDEIGRFQRGDLADLDPSVEHQPVADTDEPCICLIATDQRLRFSGAFSRMLQPLIGI
jgi:putative transcriptional regulator